MSVFGTYSKYYNLLYKDKDYAAESQYLHNLIQQYASGAKSILNLGCGTGRHDFELAKLGYDVTGVDFSEDMLAVANSYLTSLDHQLSSGSCSFQHGDIRTIRLDQTFDVVVSLFHVMSYQITNESLKAVFATAGAQLKSSGLFMFDCWYGPAVLANPPVVRVKRLEDIEISVIRIAEPVLHYNENVVDVNYQVIITEKTTGKFEQLQETHKMRYLFMPEISEYLKSHDFRMVCAEEWVTGKQPANDTWSVCCLGIGG